MTSEYNPFTILTREDFEEWTLLEELAELCGLSADDMEELVDPYAIAVEVDIHPDRNKEFLAGHLYQENPNSPPKLVSAVFSSPAYESCFSFDTVVLPEFQGRGLGAGLVDYAMGEYEDLLNSREYLYPGSDFEYCVHVVNANAKRLLERKGFFVYSGVDGDWMMKRGESL